MIFAKFVLSIHSQKRVIFHVKLDREYSVYHKKGWSLKYKLGHSIEFI